MSPVRLPSLPTLQNDRNASLITALLGPTNTGKTHRAIERMVAHGEGMMGLPLRLLAREVYERVCQQVGPEAVALITGEERIEPRDARFWVCTVESMPMHRDVAFVAVDEIQLATHPERGHVFTDRLLNARGTRETWFLGSDTMADMVERLVPTAQIHSQERFSQLRYVGERKLAGLPPRSAVIAFSVGHVYELAERLRRAHGGAAVVLGSLSPRARNAQVQMFESGQVQHLVSTDAIGMGLNLDIHYVYFASLRKFDGVELRPLEPWEVGQIAGRAGRGRREGFFGALRDGADSFTPRLVEAVEKQSFHPERRVWYRNSDLDFSSVQALRESLARKPWARCLEATPRMLDERSLLRLLQDPDIAQAADASPQRVELLWEVCRVPDFRQSSEAAHARLLGHLFKQLVGPRGRVSSTWMERQLRHLEDMEGGMDAMMHRLAQNRTWAYLAHRENWLEEPERWRQRSLQLEEQLSAALHARLTSHFVEESVQVQVERAVPHDVALDGDVITTRTLPLGRVRDFALRVDPEAAVLFGHKVARRHGLMAARASVQEQVQQLLAQETLELEPSADLALRWNGQALAWLRRGSELTRPQLTFKSLELVEEPLRPVLQERVRAWLRDAMQALLEPLEEPEEANAPRRGILYLLRSGLGVVPRAEAESLVRALEEEDKLFLARRSVRLGRRYLYAMPLLKPGAQPLRAALWALWMQMERRPELPGDSVAPELDWPAPFARAMGWPMLSPRFVRVDMLERVTSWLRRNVKQGPVPLPTEPMQWMGCTQPTWEAMLESLGYRLRHDGLYPPRKEKPRRHRRGPGKKEEA